VFAQDKDESAKQVEVTDGQRMPPRDEIKRLGYQIGNYDKGEVETSEFAQALAESK
jgi:hypothetical protein